MSNFKQAVSAIVFRGNDVLLIKRRDIPVWVLPGGGIEPGESPEIAALREAYEETGFTVKIVRKVAEYQPVNKMTQVTHFFECEITSGEASLSSETREVAFFPLNALPKIMAPPHRYWVHDAAAKYQEVLKTPIQGASYGNLVKHLFLHPILVFRFLLTKMGIHINS